MVQAFEIPGHPLPCKLSVIASISDLEISSNASNAASNSAQTSASAGLT